jgi:hypothetical protein
LEFGDPNGESARKLQATRSLDFSSTPSLQDASVHFPTLYGKRQDRPPAPPVSGAVSMLSSRPFVARSQIGSVLSVEPHSETPLNSLEAHPKDLESR